VFEQTFKNIDNVLRPEAGCQNELDYIEQTSWIIFLKYLDGKPNQNAYVESFNGRFRDECLNEHWFMSLAHARAVIEEWRQEYNDERPKRSLGGLTPSQYAKQLANAGGL